MSDLRQHLESARREYSAAGYPGSLAADVLRPAATKPATGRRVVLAGATAAAAAIAIAFWLSSRTPVVPLVRAPDESAQTEDVALVNMGSMDLSGLSGESSIVPPAVDLSFSMPAITFAVDESTSTTPTTREAV